MAIYLGNTPIAENVTIQQGGGVTIDDTLSDTSKNPVQNKVINAALNSKANTSDIPTSLPANGGNADTVDGKHASDFFNNIADIITPESSGKETLVEYIRTLDSSTSNFYADSFDDLPTSNWGYNVTVYKAWGAIYVIAYRALSNNEIYVRCFTGSGEWNGDWTRLNDGGNADTVDGKHASDFAPYYSYAPIFTGNILDIIEMGTYSCDKSDCTNLPQEITNWCYITMYRFRDTGYKRFICTKLNAIGSNDCGVIYLASESYKDADGNLIWSRACDGGDADTVDGLHANGFVKVNSNGSYDCNTLYDTGLYLCGGSATNTPNDLKYGTLLVMPYRKPYGNAKIDYCAQIFIPNGDCKDTSLWYRTSLLDSWNEWTRSCDGGNAATLESHPASDFALKTDIPTTLPANGGNADTVDGKHASDLITHYGLIADSNLDPNTRGCWDANITGISIGWANVVQFENGHFITQIAFGASTGKTCSLRLRTRYASSEFESWESDWNYIETVQNAITANTAGTLATTATNVCLRNISAGTADLVAGTTALETGAIYLVYE